LCLGSLRKGDFGFIFARPETGKTTFLASEISYFAEQCDSPILWFNNEEQGSKVQLRIYQASTGTRLIELFNNTIRYKNEYSNKTGNRIKIFDSTGITKHTVETIIINSKPACIVFDQLDKIQGFSGDREDLRLGDIYIWARELAKKYCPVIGVCQSDASGEGKRWLTMDNVANAKTAKQAEADWIIGIGKTHNESEEYQRFLSICKNKLMGDEDTEPMLRHGHLSVKILPDIARFED
jgi:KaiC/GvpD/RAD55 family RecA-like ATPase